MALRWQQGALQPQKCRSKEMVPLMSVHRVASLIQPAIRTETVWGGADTRPHHHRIREAAVCRVAVAYPGSSGKDEDLGYWLETLILGALFGAWYVSNIVFNIYNKQALQMLPQPLTMTTMQLMISSVLALLLWATGLVKRPKITAQLLKGTLPLAAVHCAGNLLTNMSLGAVAVSFTHTIKAMEPFFSVMLSAMFLGEAPTLPVVLTLLPIVGGVAVASISEASFNWLGFLTAMGSNLTFQSRNVLSKRLMLKEDGDGLDNISMFSVITILSLVLLLPFQLAFEGLAFLPSSLVTAGVACPDLFMQLVFMASLCRSADQQVSYMILRRVSPVTHSIGNCVKRVVVIVAAVLFFGNPITLQNALGTAIALGGVFSYTQVKRMQREAESAAVWAPKGDDTHVLPDQTIDQLPN